MIRLAKLGADHNLAGFDCGNDELNDWLICHARTATGHGTITWLAFDEFSGDELVGYISLAPYSIERATLGRRGRGAPNRVPGYILARLAVAAHRQGEHMGAALLAYALGIVVNSARQTGGKWMVVDAIDDAAIAFYIKHGFVAVPDNEGRLIQKLVDVAAALELDWP